MSTNSNRSAGTQVTKKGITQGTVLVDPVSGNPVDVVQDITGTRRLAVDANITAQIPEVKVDVRYTDGDSVAIGDPNTNTTLKIESDGSINANVVLSASTGDSILSVGTEDGTPTGTQHVLKVGSDLNLRVKDEAANITLSDIDSKVATAANQVIEQTKLDTLHSDLTTIDSDLNSFKTQNHSDLVTIDSDVNSFKSANHTDLSQIDSDLNAFKTANHTDLSTLHSDLVTIEGKQDTGNANLASIDSHIDVAVSTRASESTLSTLNSKVTSFDLDSGVGTQNVVGVSLRKTASGGSVEFGTATDPIRIDPTGTTPQPASQSGTWNITNITGVVSLPTGAATAANQTSVIGSSGAGAAATNSTQIGGVFNTTLPTLTTGQQSSIQLDSSGRQIVVGSGTSGTPSGGVLSIQGTGGTGASPVIVAGSAAVGAAPVNNPVSVSGVDGGGLKRNIATDTAGNTSVVGNVASGVTDSGNPVKTGAILNTTPPLLTNGQRGDSQADENAVTMVNHSKAGYTAMGKAFSVSNTTLTVGTSETAIMLFKNPSESATKARILKFVFTGAATFRVYVTPTTTANGTALTPVNQRIGNLTTANVTPFQSPTVTANGTLWFPTTVSAQTGTFIYYMYHEPILNANNTILITAQAGSNNTPVNAVPFWEEVP